MKKLIAGGGALTLFPVFLLFFIGASPEPQSGIPNNVPPEYLGYVMQAGSICPEITPTIIAAQIDAESTWSTDVVSSTGAKGISQFMPDAWADYGGDYNGDGVSNLLDPADAIIAQGHMMCDMISQVTALKESGEVSGDTLDLALAAYNAGIGKVTEAGGIPDEEETENYVVKVRELMVEKYAPISGSTIPGGVDATSKVVNAAMKYIGVPYVWGGETAAGLDCSGLVMLTYSEFGVSMPHAADLQARVVGKSIYWGSGATPPWDQMKPGDIVAFSDSDGAFFQHVALYVGGQQMIQAPQPGTVVELSEMTSGYWRNQLWSIRRVFD